jgi:hypothetical protein
MWCEFPTASAFRDTQGYGGEGRFSFASSGSWRLRVRALTAKIGKDFEKFAKKIIPRVLVETPAPPALRKERIGKETAAGIVPPVCVFSSTAF